jgi:hypothetical protein
LGGLIPRGCIIDAVAARRPGNEGRPPGAWGGPTRPPSRSPPGSPAVPPSPAHRDDGASGRALLKAHKTPGSHPPSPSCSHRPTSRPGRSATSSRSVRRHRPPHVATTPTPTRPASRRADVHACEVWGSAGQTSRQPRRTRAAPRNHVGPLTNGRRYGDEVGHLEARSPSGQPMLEGASELPGRLA